MSSHYYDLQRFKPGAGTFIDSDNEQVAVNIALEEYDDEPDFLYVLHRSNDFEATPTHVVLHDVLYKLVEVDKPEFVPTADQIDEMVESGICLECGAEIDMCGHAEKFGIVIEVEDDEDDE